MSLRRTRLRAAVRRVLSTGLTAALALGLAATSAPSGAPATADPVPGSVPVMVVLDASGSMTAADAPGPRIDAAKAAVASLVETLDPSARIGLTVYGTQTGSSDGERDAGCQDILTLVPVGPLDRGAYVAAVNGVQAQGYTPIGAALTHAAAALPAGEPASIVLVSDGEDTCAPPPPCDVAAQLKAANPGLVVHTIGFLVDQTARDQLTCIADATGGLYGDAADAGRLGALLRGQVDAGLHPYLTSGTPIVGTPEPMDAPAIEQGQYTDSFPAGPGATRHYAIDLVDRQTVYVATTVIPGALRGSAVDNKLTVRTRLIDARGESCLSTDRESESVESDKVDPVTSLLSGEVGGDAWSKRCATPGTFYVEVTRDSTTTAPTASETIVRLEAPVDGPLPAPSAPPGALPAPAIGDPAGDCGGAASFGAAPALAGGATCADTLATGETKYYRVALDWGQRLSYQIEVDPVPNADRSSSITSGVFSPMRERLTLPGGNAERGFGGPYAVAVNSSTLVAVEYGNRQSSNSGVRSYSLAGDYYISLGLTYPTEAAPARTGVRISLLVDGAPHAGPDYLPMPEADPSPGSGQPTASGSPAGPTGSQAPTADGSGSDTSVPVWVWAVVAVAGAVAAGTAGLLLVRRPRRRS